MTFGAEGTKRHIDKGKKSIDLVMVNKICMYEVQLDNRIKLIAEKCPGKRNNHIWRRNIHKMEENQSTFGGESVHIDHCLAEDVETNRNDPRMTL